MPVFCDDDFSVVGDLEGTLVNAHQDHDNDARVIDDFAIRVIIGNSGRGPR